MVKLRSIARVALLAGLMSSPAFAVTWDMPTPYGDNNFHTQNIQQFANDVKKATNGAPAGSPSAFAMG